MKNNGLLLTMGFIAFALNACGGHVSAAAPSVEEIISSANTVVALTRTAQPTNTAVATPTAVSTATPSVVAISPDSFANQIESPSPVTPTAEILRYSESGDYEPGKQTSLCDSSAFMEDVNIPDGTVFGPGESFTKTWKIKNNGTCIWNKFYTVVLFSGEGMSGETTAIRRPIQPGEEANVSVDLIAPGAEGTYTGYWIMVNSQGLPFGNPFYVQVAVTVDETSE